MTTLNSKNNHFNLKHYLIYIFLLLTPYATHAQTFTEQTSIVLPSVYDGTVAWGDYNNDGFLDFVLSGKDTANNYITNLYKNINGSGFSLQSGIQFPGVTNFADADPIAWGDYNNDGYLDLLITGKDTSNIDISKLFKNNGNNTFTEQTSVNLIGVSSGSVAWGDYDNDGLIDILLSGYSSSGRITKVYKNNGNNTFSDQISVILPGVSNSTVRWGDLNNDGFLDILLLGYNLTSSSKISKIFINQGNNTFQEQINASLIGVTWGDGKIVDYDNDGDLDIILMGKDQNNGHQTKVYNNSGFPNYTFSDVTNTSITQTYIGSIDVGDYDNDGDVDILLTGNSSTGNISKLFKYSGNNTFTEQTNISLSPVSNGEAKWADYDNDGDLDILLVGQNYINSVQYLYAKIYKNNSTISNTKPTTPIGLSGQIIGVGDTILFSWNKTNDNQTPADGLSYNIRIGTSLNAIDVKSPQSNLSTGKSFVVEKGLIQDTCYKLVMPSSILYGDYIYWQVQAVDAGFASSIFSTIDSIKNSLSILAISDTNLIFPYDTVQLGVIHNAVGSVTYVWSPAACLDNPNIQNPKAVVSKPTLFKVTVTDGTDSETDSVFVDVESFTEQTGISLPGINAGAIRWGDYDNDDDLDILIVGFGVASIYENNGNNTFTNLSGLPFQTVNAASAEWGDFNNDNYLDVILMGSGNAQAKLYINQTNGTFQEDTCASNSIIGVGWGDLDWGDYDNDGDLDLIITGGNHTRIYKNNGTSINCTGWQFEEQTNINIQGFTSCTVEWGDYDNDGDLDILLTGSGNETIIYRNNGVDTVLLSWKFEKQTSIQLFGVTSGNASWGDYDNDGDLDILITGPLTKVYRNNGNNTFTELTNNTFTNVTYCSSEWGDYDNDGDLDILIGGKLSSTQYTTEIYINEGNDIFTELKNTSLIEVQDCDFSWGDYDNDGDLDLLICGYSQINGVITKVYKNNVLKSNEKPSIPTGLTTQLLGDSILFSWHSSLDDESQALTYNISIGSNSDLINIQSPQANLSNGFHKVVERGIIQDTVFIISDSSFAALDTLFWTIQAVDNSGKASGFAQTNIRIKPQSCGLSLKLTQAQSSAMLCEGDSIRLSGTPISNVTYAWTHNGAVIPNSDDSVFYAKDPGFYMLVASNSSCTMLSTNYFVLANYPNVPPQINVIGNIAPCSNDSLKLEASSGYSSYIWNNGQLGQSIYTNTSSYYSVEAIDNNGCITQSLETVINASAIEIPKICVVTTDSISNNNRIRWTSPNTLKIDSFRVYKETTINNEYLLIASLPFATMSEFIDVNSNSAMRQYSYKLSAIDTCGKETPVSLKHKTMHLQVNAAMNNHWNLVWQPYTGFNFGSYNIYRGTDSLNMLLLATVPSNINSYSDLTNPQGNVFYRIEIQSFDICQNTFYPISRSNLINTKNASGVGFNPQVENKIIAKVFPNPNNGKFTLKIDNAKRGRIDLVIYNLMGSMVYCEQLDIGGNYSKNIDLSTFAKGIYILSLVRDSGSIYYAKIIID